MEDSFSPRSFDCLTSVLYLDDTSAQAVFARCSTDLKQSAIRRICRDGQVVPRPDGRHGTGESRAASSCILGG